ncbi:MAG TPA: rod shape-determining protein MreD [Sedimentibacter sp.]|nr:rod shape-determining protein MreD [Sedimentibacter sp.]
MKKLILMSSLIVIGFVFQTSFIGFFNYFKILPNIPLILLVIFAMLSDGVEGGVLGILTGILHDAMIYDVFGIYTLIYFFIGAVIGAFSDEMLRENKLVYSAVTGISTVVMHLLLFLILFFLRFRVHLAKSILPNILFETALNAVLVIFVLKFVIYIFDRFNVKA